MIQRKVRCAIYTRKSSEEGLEQGFNSLDAQREACAAYILSQASEGWTLHPEPYDDGGLSGGTLERPALQRLLGDIAAGRIDIVVVYKVDRLTRSLMDFSKLVEAFDAAKVSFVSVTQSFNTTTSMGRLTLNMLLSFAQFEREVTAERIRDKIAASKAKGMWMGGTPPLGYEPDGRTLRIVADHAGLVRDIYRRYLEFGNVRLLEQALARERIRTPRRGYVNGKSFGGVAFSRGQLYAILRNPIYIGDIPHKGRRHPGLHPPIVDRDIWQQTQDMLAGNLKGERTITRASRSPLAGRIVDEQGEPLVATHARKGNQRYRYYVSKALQFGTSTDRRGVRIPAREIEALVAGQVAGLFDDPLALAGRAGIALTPELVPHLAERGGLAAAELRLRGGRLDALVRQVRVLRDGIEIDIATAAIADLLHGSLSDSSELTLTIRSDARLTRTGRAIQLVQGDGCATTAAADPVLLRLIVKARRWWSILRQGEHTVETLGKQEGVGGAWVTRVVRLAFLSPAIVEGVLEGKLRAGIDATAFNRTDAVPALWSEQHRRYLPPGSCRDRSFWSDLRISV